MSHIEDETRQDIGQALHAAMANLSEERWAAGWLVDLEHVLWEDDSNVAAGLRHIARTFDVWVVGSVWREDRNEWEPDLVDLLEWDALHELWLERRAIIKAKYSG